MAHREPTNLRPEVEDFDTEQRRLRRPAAYEPRDFVRWGPIVAGVVTSFASLLVLSVLGLAIGLSTVDPANVAPNALATSGIWAAASMLVALFLGGWAAARASGVGGTFAAWFNGAMVWAAWLTMVLIVAGIGGAIGLGGTANGLPGVNTGTLTPGAVATASSAAWWTLVGLLVSLGAAILGGFVGRHDSPKPSDYAPSSQGDRH